MGGFAFQIPQSKEFAPFHTEDTIFVSDKGIRSLLKQETSGNSVPNLSELEVKSKSKANGIAKSLVCVQALWFMAQCITRGM